MKMKLKVLDEACWQGALCINGASTGEVAAYTERSFEGASMRTRSRTILDAYFLALITRVCNEQSMYRPHVRRHRTAFCCLRHRPQNKILGKVDFDYFIGNPAGQRTTDLSSRQKKRYKIEGKLTPTLSGKPKRNDRLLAWR